MLKACDKLDLYVSPNLKKDETARRIAQEMLDSPIEILSRLNKQELQIVEQFKEHLDPIMREGSKVLQEMEQIISSPHISPNNKPRYESDYQRLLSQYEYLF